MKYSGTKTISVLWFVILFALLLNGACQTSQDEEDTSPGYYDYGCGDEIITPVEWTEMTDLGVTPEEAFNGVAGTCTAPMTWDGTSFAPLAVSPLSGVSDAAIEIVLDHDSAYLIEWEELPDSWDPCTEAYLVVDGTAWIETADGVFNEMGEVSFWSDGQDIVQRGQFELDIDSIVGSLEIGPLETDESASLDFEFDAVGNTCAGKVDLTQTTPLGDGTAVTGVGQLGSWSDSECDLGYTPVDLSQPIGDSPPVLDWLVETWGDYSVAATWKDEGQDTTFSVEVDFPNPIACQQGAPAELDAQVIYKTLDGSLGPRNIPAMSFSVSIGDDGVPWTSEMYSSDDIVCESETSEMPYAFGTCETLLSITVQLGLSIDVDGNVGVSDEGVMIFEYDRNSDSPPGAADRVRILSLFP